jgi:hypothetical protein
MEMRAQGCAFTGRQAAQRGGGQIAAPPHAACVVAHTDTGIGDVLGNYLSVKR